jgi:SAM-dependent methyltransferase
MSSDSAFAQVPIEKVQAFWNARPCNIRHSPKPVGTKEYFDEVEKRKYFVESHIPGFADFPKWRGKKVLEVGCGIGTDTINFARNGAAVTVVELSDESMKVAQQRAKLFGLADKITFISGNAEQLPRLMPPQKFDLVYSFGVIHHSPQPQTIVQHIRNNYMGPQSELRLMVYAKACYKLFWIMKEENVWDMGRADELVARNSEAQSGCPVTYSYTFADARRLLAGFDILDMRKAHIFTWDIPTYKKYEYKKDPAWAGVSDEQLTELEKELGWHLLITAKLAQS